jgi:hypothetical protein
MVIYVKCDQRSFEESDHRFDFIAAGSGIRGTESQIIEAVAAKTKVFRHTK